MNIEIRTWMQKGPSVRKQRAAALEEHPLSGKAKAAPDAPRLFSKRFKAQRTPQVVKLPTLMLTNSQVKPLAQTSRQKLLEVLRA